MVCSLEWGFKARLFELGHEFHVDAGPLGSSRHLNGGAGGPYADQLVIWGVQGVKVGHVGSVCRCVDHMAPIGLGGGQDGGEVSRMLPVSDSSLTPTASFPHGLGDAGHEFHFDAGPLW